MKILVINNNTSYVEQLRKLFLPNKVDVIDWDFINSERVRIYDLIVLSGGHPNSIKYQHELYEKELRLILRLDKPILGICLGFELIVYAFGGKLKEMLHKEKGSLKIKVIKKDLIFKDITELEVYESHRWVADSLPEELEELARSRDGIEIVRHKTRFIYGFQFHPEIIVSKKDLRIFENFLNLAKNSSMQSQKF